MKRYTVRITSASIATNPNAPSGVLKVYFRKQLIILQSVCELCDVVTTSAFFSFVLQMDGPLQYQKWPKIARGALYKLGFRIEEYIAVNGAIQLAVEVMTDILLAGIESYLGINALEIISPFSAKNYTLIFTAVSCAYGLFCPFIFFCQCFTFPILQKTFGSVAGYDLEGTWIEYLSNAVEVTYAAEFIDSL